MSQLQLFTIGHSNRSLEAFLGLLQQHGIGQLIDVRRIPRSRFNPHFNENRLQASLAGAGMEYVSLPELGGMRTAQKNSPNTGMKEDSGFRGFADYMQAPEFERTLRQLLQLAKDKRTAFMCAERDPYNCHRQLIADTLVARGHEITHIVTESETRPHALKEGAVIVNDLPTYPAKPAPQLTML